MKYVFHVGKAQKVKAGWTFRAEFPLLTEEVLGFSDCISKQQLLP